MIGAEEAALWRQAEESSDALEVYVDWLLTHDPSRGELVRKRMRLVELAPAEQAEERRAWSAALGLEGVCDYVGFARLPSFVVIPAERLAAIDRMLEELPFLHIRVSFTETASVAPTFASPTMARIRALSFLTQGYESTNYQSDPYYEFAGLVIATLCESSHVHQLEVLHVIEDAGSNAAALIAAVPFVALRELRFRETAILDEGAIAIARSPLGKTLRRLALHDNGMGGIGDAGALALSETELAELEISHHSIGYAAVRALRAMPSMKRLSLSTAIQWESLDLFRTLCREPLAQCATCSAIPDSCYRSHASSMVADYDIDYGGEGRHDDVPPQVAQLQPFLDASREELTSAELGGHRDEAVLRCPTCNRLYLVTSEFEMIGAANYSRTIYARTDAASVFHSRSGVIRRLPLRDIERVHALKHHAIVRFTDARYWYSLDDKNQLVELDRDRWAQLIAVDPPDPTRAAGFAELTREIEDSATR